MEVANTPAYYDMATITTVKSFIVVTLYLIFIRDKQEHLQMTVNSTLEKHINICGKG
jgi:hypothetical protein